MRLTKEGYIPGFVWPAIGMHPWPSVNV